MLGDSLKRRRQGPDGPERPTGGGGWKWSLPPFSWPVWVGAAVAVLVGGYLVGYLLSTLVLFPRPETAGTGVPVPDLQGETRAEAEVALQTAGLRLGEVREMASMNAERGRVLAQDPLPGQQLLPGAVVSLGVSAGPPELRVPPLVGLREGTARTLLETVGFDVTVQQTRSAEFPRGVVARADPLPGTPQQLPSRVTLVVSVGPPDPVADTAEPGGQP